MRRVCRGRAAGVEPGAAPHSPLMPGFGRLRREEVQYTRPSSSRAKPEGSLATPELLRRLCPADVAGVRSVVNGRFGLVSGLVLLRVVGLVSSSGAREPRPKRLTARGEGPVYQGPTATIPIQAIQKIRPRLRSLAVRLRNRSRPTFGLNCDGGVVPFMPERSAGRCGSTPRTSTRSGSRARKAAS